MQADLSGFKTVQAYLKKHIGEQQLDIERKITDKIFYEYNDIEILWTNIDKRPAKEQIPYRLEVKYKEGLILGLELALEYIKEVSNGN